MLAARGAGDLVLGDIAFQLFVGPAVDDHISDVMFMHVVLYKLVGSES